MELSGVNESYTKLPEKAKLEVTDTLIMRNIASGLYKLYTINDVYGVRIALDNMTISRMVDKWKNTVLSCAISMSFGFEFIKTLLDYGEFDFRHKQVFLIEPLKAAIKNCDLIKIVKALVAKGLTPTDIESEHLELAYRKNRPKVFKYLLEMIHSVSCNFLDKTNSDMPNIDLDTFKLLISKMSVEDILWKDNGLVGYCCADKKRFPQLKWLVDKFPLLLQTRDPSAKRTALEHAAHAANDLALMYILNKGVNINTVNPVNRGNLFVSLSLAPRPTIPKSPWISNEAHDRMLREFNISKEMVKALLRAGMSIEYSLESSKFYQGYRIHCSHMEYMRWWHLFQTLTSPVVVKRIRKGKAYLTADLIRQCAEYLGYSTAK